MINIHVHVLIWTLISTYLGKYLKKISCCMEWQNHVYLCKKCLICLPKHIYHFAFPLVMNRSSCRSASWLAVWCFTAIWIFYSQWHKAFNIFSHVLVGLSSLVRYKSIGFFKPVFNHFGLLFITVDVKHDFTFWKTVLFQKCFSNISPTL